MRSGAIAEVNGEVCPIPVAMLGVLYRSGEVEAVLADIPPRTRARLAVYLYGRSHTHELGLAVAATCTVEDLHAVAGRLGVEIHALGCKPRAPVAVREGKLFAKSRISLGGSRAT